MKKKGLIISTVVMAVVLIASLTTATYAWFSSSAATTVDQMTISVNAASDVVVGIAKNANAKSSAGQASADDNNYMNGTVTMNGSNGLYATGGVDSLGTQLTIQFPGAATSSEIQLSKAVATATTSTFREATDAPDATAGQAQLTMKSSKAVFDPTQTIFTANSSTTGTTQTEKDENFDDYSIKTAVANQDYIYLPIGVRAAKSGIAVINCNITITITDLAANLKDNAALHFYIVNGDDTQEIDIFGIYTGTTSKATGVTDNTKDGKVDGSGTALGDIVEGITYNKDSNGVVSATFSFVVAKNDSGLGYTSSEDVSFFEIYAYVFGPDPDCTSAGTGTSVSFNMNFTGTPVQTA